MFLSFLALLYDKRCSLNPGFPTWIPHCDMIFHGWRACLSISGKLKPHLPGTELIWTLFHTFLCVNPCKKKKKLGIIQNKQVYSIIVYIYIYRELKFLVLHQPAVNSCWDSEVILQHHLDVNGWINPWGPMRKHGFTKRFTSLDVNGRDEIPKMVEINRYKPVHIISFLKC